MAQALPCRRCGHSLSIHARQGRVLPQHNPYPCRLDGCKCKDYVPPEKDNSPDGNRKRPAR